MLRELLSIFGSANPLAAMNEDFTRMLQLTQETTRTAGDAFFSNQSSEVEKSAIYQKDIQVNQLERKIRKQIVTHLSVRGTSLDLPYCLLLMSLVKDVERIGDYAKNIVELTDFLTHDLPDDEITKELLAIRHEVAEAFAAASQTLTSLEKDRAMRLIQDGRQIARRSDALIERIARADYDAATATALALGTRYYKRIGGHLLNIISSVVMPVHKVDYWDEDELLPDD